MIEPFIQQFTDERIVNPNDVYELGEEVFSVTPNLFQIGKDLPRKPVFVGAFLGRRKKGYFVPGIHLLDLLAKSKTKKVFVNNKAAMIFVYGKNVLKQSITKSERNPKQGDWVLVMSNDDCLGFGVVQPDGTVRNVFDIGDYLRRERSTKKYLSFHHKKSS